MVTFRSSIETIKHCYGCGVCYAACPHNAVEMVLNSEGFLQSSVRAERCVKCGVCARICPTLSEKDVLHSNFDVYAARVKDVAILQKSSSGGLIPLMAKTLADKGFKLCGVRYSPECERAEHFIAETFEDFEDAYGSKYLQSYAAEAFAEIVNAGGKYLIVGTPCQIEGMRKLLDMKNRSKDVVLVDFWCHGVPSLRLWHSFLKLKHVKGYGLNAKWRDKSKFGWYNGYSVTLTDGKEVVFSRSYLDGERFTRHFIRSSCTNTTCMDCPYDTLYSAADIRVGDYWDERFRAENVGVSKVAVLTNVGRMLWESIAGELKCYPISDHDKNIVVSLKCGNHGAPRGLERFVFIRLLRMPWGFAFAHIWHLGWVALRRGFGLLGDGE